MEEKILEGKKEMVENDLAVTSADDESQKVELNSNPIPTEEEKEDAGLIENVEEEKPIEKTFTQSQVNDIVGKTRFETREKTFKYIYDRYGVNDEEGLDALVGNSQRFETLKGKYDADTENWNSKEKEYEKIRERVALLESGIDKERFDDASFILKGKGLPVTLENITNELVTHPEWKKVENVNFEKITPSEPETKISVLGNKPYTPKKEVDEEDEILGKFYKV